MKQKKSSQPSQTSCCGDAKRQSEGLGAGPAIESEESTESMVTVSAYFSVYVCIPFFSIYKYDICFRYSMSISQQEFNRFPTSKTILKLHNAVTQNHCSPFVADAHREREIIHLHQKELSCRHTDTNQHSSEHMPQRLLRRFEAISCSEMSGVFHHIQQTSRMEGDKDFENPGAGELSTMSSTGSLEQQFLLSRAF